MSSDNEITTTNVSRTSLDCKVTQVTPPLSTPGDSISAQSAATVTAEATEAVETLEIARDKKIQEYNEPTSEENASSVVGHMERGYGKHMMQKILTKESKGSVFKKIFGHLHDEGEKEIAACLMLQGAWRVRRARMQAYKIRYKRKELGEERGGIVETEDVTCVQTQWKTHDDGHNVLSLQINHDASTNISRLYRGYMARKIIRRAQMNSLQCVKLFIQKAFSLNVGDGLTASSDPYVLVSTMCDPESICDAGHFARNFINNPQGSNTGESKSAKDSKSHAGNQSTLVLKTIALSRTSSKSNTLAPEWNEEIIVSSVTSSSYITLTVIDKDFISLNGADFLGQYTIRIGDYLELYRRDNEVIFENVPIGNFKHRIHDDKEKEVKLRGKQMVGKGFISFSAILPPLYANMSGWLMLKSRGLINRDYKRKWIVLSGDTLWHFDSPWTMERVKGKVKTCNLTDIIYEDGDTEAWSIRFYDDEISSNVNEIGETGEQSTWEFRWDPQNSTSEREAWRRRLKAASPMVFRKWLNESGIKYRTRGQIAARAARSSAASLSHGVVKITQKAKRSFF